VVVYAALVLWLMRGVGFVDDDIPTYTSSHGLSPGALIEPYNGHLIAVTRFIFAGSIRVFGLEHGPIQVAVVIAGAAAAIALFALLRRRLPPYPSLAFALVVLFFGTTGVTLLSSVTMFAQAAAFGLAAYIALDSRLRWRDPIACVLLILSVLSFEVGIGFAVGAAAWILVQTDWRRIWVAAIPVALYVAWYIWAPPFGTTELTNVLLIPNYAATSAAAALAALAGLSVDFTLLTPQRAIDIGWGQVFAVLFAVATAVQAYRRGISGLFIAGVGILAVLWIGGGITLNSIRTPESARYAYPVAIAFILIFSATFSGYLPGRRGLIASVVFLLIAMPLNLWELQAGGTGTRTKSDLAAAALSVIEMQRDQVRPDDYLSSSIPVTAGEYLEASDRLGSIALPVAALPAQSQQVRIWVDGLLAGTVPPRLVPATEKPTGCTRSTDAEVGAGVVVEPGTVVVAKASAHLVLRRFSDEFSIPAGDLSANVPTSIVLPTDASPQPWLATTNPLQPLKVCDSDSTSD